MNENGLSNKVATSLMPAKGNKGDAALVVHFIKWPISMARWQI